MIVSNDEKRSKKYKGNSFIAGIAGIISVAIVVIVFSYVVSKVCGFQRYNIVSKNNRR